MDTEKHQDALVRADRRAWAGLVVLVLAVTLIAIDGTVLYLAVPAITADLAPSATQLLWIGDIYSFVIAGLLVTMGNVADRIGRKRMLLIGSMAFGVASVLAAFSPNAETLIAARALLGVAGATIMPSTLSIIRNMFPHPTDRTRAIAIWSAGAMAGGAIGPLVGGALLEVFWWGSVFLINVPVIILIVGLGSWLLKESKNPTRVPLDFASAALSVLAIVPLVYVLKQAFTGELSWLSIVLTALSILSMVLFVRRQRQTEHPLVDLSLFKIPAFSGAVLSNTLTIFAFFGVLFFFSQYLQLVRGYSPLIAGLAEMPATVASMLVVLLVGVTLAKLGLGRAIALGIVIAAVGLIVMALSIHAESFLVLGIAIAIMGLGTGLSMTLSTDAIVASAPPARAGAASAISETGYELGIALGIGVLGSLHTALYRNSIALPPGTPEQQVGLVEDSLANATYALDSSPGGQEILAHAQAAFTHALQITAFTSSAFLLLAAWVAWKWIPSSTQPKAAAHD